MEKGGLSSDKNYGILCERKEYTIYNSFKILNVKSIFQLKTQITEKYFQEMSEVIHFLTCNVAVEEVA